MFSLIPFELAEADVPQLNLVFSALRHLRVRRKDVRVVSTRHLDLVSPSVALLTASQPDPREIALTDNIPTEMMKMMLSGQLLCAVPGPPRLGSSCLGFLRIRLLLSSSRDTQDTRSSSRIFCKQGTSTAAGGEASPGRRDGTTSPARSKRTAQAIL